MTGAERKVRYRRKRILPGSDPFEHVGTLESAREVTAKRAPSLLPFFDQEAATEIPDEE